MVTIELMFTGYQMLLIFIIVLQKRNYYLILRMKKQVERLIFSTSM